MKLMTARSMTARRAALSAFAGKCDETWPEEPLAPMVIGLPEPGQSPSGLDGASAPFGATPLTEPQTRVRPA